MFETNRTGETHLMFDVFLQASDCSQNDAKLDGALITRMLANRLKPQWPKLPLSRLSREIYDLKNAEENLLGLLRNSKYVM